MLTAFGNAVLALQLLGAVRSWSPCTSSLSRAPRPDTRAQIMTPIVRNAIQSTLTNPECSRGFVLDGYPRTMYHAQVLDGILKDVGKSVRACALQCTLLALTTLERAYVLGECCVVGIRVVGEGLHLIW